ncbi:unnamed protein product [Soboliphyme baturini]|uniref:DUF1540 domain-containing protein n=1 Tax=Soboliphyme baturini TaxID=241478 RepID=A0A183IUH5_9BILA|nr:unnamed protein product [Soboliphyme baturini]
MHTGFRRPFCFCRVGTCNDVNYDRWLGRAQKQTDNDVCKPMSTSVNNPLFASAVDEHCWVYNSADARLSAIAGRDQVT